jgi:hypothetical protein
MIDFVDALKAKKLDFLLAEPSFSKDGSAFVFPTSQHLQATPQTTGS